MDECNESVRKFFLSKKCEKVGITPVRICENIL